MHYKKASLICLCVISCIFQINAKINPEKIKQNLIGSWAFYKEFTYRPIVWDTEHFFKDGDNPCQINRTFHFNADGTCEIKSLNKDKCEGIASDLRWTIGTINDAQGQERAVIIIEGDLSDVDIYLYDTQHRNKIILMVMDVKKDRLILSKKSRNGIFDGPKVSNLWCNYYKRYVNY
ncbi:MAG: hypothetical protein FWD60_00325 [Candidatus Azobacteroides sp.]|nr:hypothetical protein [Candidatus Azobacteroides sp.]